MANDLDVLRSALINLLFIVVILAVLSVLVVAWKAGRRRQLVVAELVNSTGHSDLDGVTRGLTQLARQRIDSELRVVSERREFLYTALRGDTRGSADSTGRRRRDQKVPAHLQQRLDDHLDQLLTAAREVAPAQAQAAVHFITVLVSMPRGLLVSGILQCRGSAGPRWGVSFDVLRIDGNRSVASQTFWEPIAQPVASGHQEQAQPDRRPADADMTHERILALLAPVGRWVAIQLVIQSTFPGGARGREMGLDRLLSGMLYSQSADGSPGFGAVFRRLALADLRDAATALPEAPSYLAALADTLDKLAAAVAESAAPPVSGAAEIYREAHTQYARALRAMAPEGQVMDRPGLALDPLVRRYRVRQAISWLASGLPEPERAALRWLEAADLDLTTDMSTNDLYDAACLYALGARRSSHRLLRATAARLLMQALALDADTPGRKIWAQAAADRQLAELPVAELVAALASDGRPGVLWSRDELDRIVEQILISEGSHGRHLPGHGRAAQLGGEGTEK